LPVLVLGEGSNTIFVQDYAGLVVLNQLKGIEVVSETADSVTVKVAAGEHWHSFVQHAVASGWYGLENLALIPGLVGAAPIQNIGAYGVEVKDTLSCVDYIDINSRERLSINNTDCAFAYRESCFKQDLAGKVVITHVTFTLSKHACVDVTYPALNKFLGSQPTPQDVFEAVVKVRSEKLPLPEHIPNTGSFFKNPVVSKQIWQEIKKQNPDLVSFPVDGQFKLAAGWLIEQAGFKGRDHNGVTVYGKQALVLVNPLKRSGKDVLDFAEQIQQEIQNRFGVLLEIEPRIYQ